MKHKLSPKERALKQLAPLFAKKEKLTIARKNTERTADGSMTLKRAIPKVISFTESGKVPGTVKKYDRTFVLFGLFLKKKYKYNAASKKESLYYLLYQTQASGNEMVVYFKEYIMNMFQASATVNDHLYSIREHVSSARTLGVVEWQCDVKNLPRGNYRSKGYNPGADFCFDLMDILEKKKNETGTFQDWRNYILIKLCWTLALRSDEVEEIRDTDLNFSEQKIKIDDKFFFDKRWLHLPTEFSKEIDQFLYVRKRFHGPLFFHHKYTKPYYQKVEAFNYAQLRTLVKRIAYEAGLLPKKNRLCIHSIRRASITYACKEAQRRGIPLEYVLEFSRHKDLKTLLIYLEESGFVQKDISTLILERTK